jgi:AraC-binding-like domain
LVSAADNAYFQVAVVASGIGRVSQDDRQAVLHPGDCVLYETTRPFQWLFRSDWDVWVFSLPTSRLGTAHRQ